MKIKDILKEEEKDWEQDNPDFKTKQTAYNKETGQYTWEVKYTPMISLDSHIMDAAEDFKKVTRKFPQDEKLEKLFKVFTGFKKAFRTHMNRKYVK